MSAMSAMIAGTAGYQDESEALAQRFESVAFEAVHREVLPLFPDRPCRVLDIGAGSGRDAAALAGRGHRVVAVEPTAGLREEGRRRHGAQPIEWVDDHLPALAQVRAGGTRFDLILCIAVWMHLDGAERPQAMAAVSALLAPGGLLVLTLRHGPVPAGRRMFQVDADETVALAAANGLALRHRGARASLFHDSVRWSVLAFSPQPAGAI